MSLDTPPPFLSDIPVCFTLVELKGTCRSGPVTWGISVKTSPNGGTAEMKMSKWSKHKPETSDQWLQLM